MKKNNLFIIAIMPIIIIFILLCQNTLLKNKLNSYHSKLKTNNINLCNIKDNYEPEKTIEKNYNCNFTVTYRIVNLLDGYIAEVPEYSSIVVDKFQTHNPIAHKIPTELKTDLETNKYYEFTYHIKGKGNITNIYDIINSIQINHSNNDNLSITLTIKETTKTGLEQIQENICE